jgi:hypothetical protein
VGSTTQRRNAKSPGLETVVGGPHVCVANACVEHVHGRFDQSQIEPFRGSSEGT